MIASPNVVFSKLTLFLYVLSNEMSAFKRGDYCVAHKLMSMFASWPCPVLSNLFMRMLKLVNECTVLSQIRCILFSPHATAANLHHRARHPTTAYRHNRSPVSA